MTPRPLRHQIFPARYARGGNSPCELLHNHCSSDRQKSLSNCMTTCHPASSARFSEFLLLTSTPAPFTRPPARGPCAFWASVLRRRPGDASMYTVSPVANRGHSTTLATVSVGARRHWLSEHAAPPSPTHAQLLMHRHSSPLQLPDGTTVVPWATARAARRFLARA